MKKTYNIFVVFHQSLNDIYYDPSLISEYEFVNVNPKNVLTSLYKDYKVINQYEFDKFYALGKWYTESEVIYNIYKNSHLYDNIDYIGFLQHDIDSSKLTKEILDNLLLNYEHINFQPYLFDIDYNQKILMDINQPNKKVGIGINCYDVIIQDYNDFYNTTYKRSDLENKTLNLCSSFILKIEIFKEMMLFIANIIESKKLDQFDTDREYRIQGGYLERYYGVWMLLNELKTVTLKLDHHFAESTIQDSLVKRMFRKLGIYK
jgi:hypothetical protein